MSVIQCKDCGKDVAKGLKKCPHCGSTKHRSFVSRHPIISLLGVMFAASILLPLTNRPPEGMSDVKPGSRPAVTHNSQSQSNKSKNIEPEKAKFDIQKALEDSRKFRKSMDEGMKSQYATYAAFDEAKEKAENFKSNASTIVKEAREAEVQAEVNELSKLQRKIFASVMQQKMIEGGQNFYFTTSGKSDEILRAKYALMSDALAYQLVNKHDLVTTAKAVGFKKIVLTDEHDYSVTYTPE